MDLPNERDLSLNEQVKLLLSAGAKQVPIAGVFWDWAASGAAKIEMDRVKAVIDVLIRRVADLEALLKENSIAFQVVLFAAEQAKHDPLAEEKAEIYCGIISEFFDPSQDLSEAIELLQTLRTVSRRDLELLRKFTANTDQPNGNLVVVRSLIDYTTLDELQEAEAPGNEPLSVDFETYGRNEIISVLPTIKRLESFGLIFVDPKRHITKDPEDGFNFDSLDVVSRQGMMLTPQGSAIARHLTAS